MAHPPRDDGMYRWVNVEGRTAADVVDEILLHLAQPQHQGGLAGEGLGLVCVWWWGGVGG